jgi:hypothetical protein
MRGDVQGQSALATSFDTMMLGALRSVHANRAAVRNDVQPSSTAPAGPHSGARYQNPREEVGAATATIADKNSRHRYPGYGRQ